MIEINLRYYLIYYCKLVLLLLLLLLSEWEGKRKSWKSDKSSADQREEDKCVCVCGWGGRRVGVDTF